jgi:shikimate kinase
VKSLLQASEIVSPELVSDPPDTCVQAMAAQPSPIPDTSGTSSESLSSRPSAAGVMTIPEMEKRIADGLGRRSIVLVGLMGCGKTSVGRKLAQRLWLPFVDADEEIERAANKSIPEIFEEHGEPYFRDGERRVIARLLRSGPQVLATGGGAFMSDATRDAIKAAGVSVWLRAELPLLMKRVSRRSNRPLLKSPDPEGSMRRFIEVRYPIYALADVPVAATCHMMSCPRPSFAPCGPAGSSDATGCNKASGTSRMRVASQLAYSAAVSWRQRPTSFGVASRTSPACRVTMPVVLPSGDMNSTVSPCRRRGPSRPCRYRP